VKKAIMFDWDGAIMASHSAILASYWAASTEVIGRRFPDTEEEIRLVRPMRAQESFGMLSQDGTVVAELIAAYHRAYMTNMHLATAFGGIPELLQDLRMRGLSVAVVTSKDSHRVAGDARKEGLAGLVDAFVTGDQTLERKPHPGPVLEGLTALGILPNEAIYVGDGPQDVIAGRGAQVFTIAVTYGLHDRDEITEVSPDAMADTVAQLAEQIESNL